MANIDGIDTTVNGGLTARPNARVAPTPGERDGHGHGPGVVARRANDTDRVELSGPAREAASAPPIREDLVDRVRGEIADDPDDYINRTLNNNIDVIIDAIAKDLFAG